MNLPILSISIPTYNRKIQLEELIEKILEIGSDEIEIVVTDNGCTDGTREMIESIKDSRLRLVSNEKPVPGLFNMILGLFNANGKYVMHCNDRDWIFIEKIPDLIDFLKKNEYSFVQTLRENKLNDDKINVYEKGFDSLIHQSCSCHPTGMIFNTKLMHKYLKKDKYLEYIEFAFVYSFLMRDLLIFEKSAQINNGCWNERPSIIKVQLKSGSVYKNQIWFAPERVELFAKSVIKHIYKNKYFHLNNEQEDEMIIYILKYFHNQLLFKKYYMADTREMKHYNLKPEFVSIFQQKNIYDNYKTNMISFLNEIKVSTNTINKWITVEKELSKGLFIKCLKTDYSILYKKIKRKLDPTYKY